MNIELTEREKDVVFFALHKLVDATKDMRAAALLDKNNRVFQPGAADAFDDLARESEQLIIKVRDHVDTAPALLEALEELLYARTDKAESMARDAIARAKSATLNPKQ